MGHLATSDAHLNVFVGGSGNLFTHCDVDRIVGLSVLDVDALLVRQHRRFGNDARLLTVFVCRRVVNAHGRINAQWALKLLHW